MKQAIFFIYIVNPIVKMMLDVGFTVHSSLGFTILKIFWTRIDGICVTNSCSRDMMQILSGPSKTFLTTDPASHFCLSSSRNNQHFLTFSYDSSGSHLAVPKRWQTSAVFYLWLRNMNKPFHVFVEVFLRKFSMIQFYKQFCLLGVQQEICQDIAVSYLMAAVRWHQY